MLGVGLSGALDKTTKRQKIGPTTSNAHVALHGTPDLEVDRVPCDVW